jgi:hypothetical protein
LHIRIHQPAKARLAFLFRFFGLFAFRDVGRNAGEANQVARRIPDLKATVMNPANGAVWTRDLIFDAYSWCVGRERPEECKDTCALLR